MMAITKPDTYDHDMYGISSDYSDVLSRIDAFKNLVYDPNCDPNAAMKQCFSLFSCLASLSGDIFGTFDNVVRTNQ
jgi:hypothetical protein